MDFKGEAIKMAHTLKDETFSFVVSILLIPHIIFFEYSNIVTFGLHLLLLIKTWIDL